MPTLSWTGKEAVVNHHLAVKFRLLKDHPDLSSGDPDTGNLLLQGDNLEGLKALLPYYGGEVDCICIDPPYNTGNEGWVYNDNVNSPEINEWLGKVVGKEAEDLNRHAKWLCMMYPRLKLLRDFLKEDGVIVVCLDENEIGHLRMIMDEIFGKTNLLATIVWNTRNTDNRVKTFLSHDHEYILVYGKSSDAKILGRVIDRSNFKNPDNDPRGPYVTDPLTGIATALERPNLHAFSMKQPETDNVWHPDPAKGWRTDEEGYNELLAKNLIWWPPNPKTGKPRKKRFLSAGAERMPASSFWPEFRSQSGAKELDNIMGERLFAFPKPVQVIQRIIDYCVPKDGLVLDSFAGSGTTAHAVLQQNAEDGGNRRFILIEMIPEIAKDITRKRIHHVCEGYTNPDGETVTGLGGGFRYASLGETLFNATGQIRDTVSFDDLARHVWFTETGCPLSKTDGPSPLLGINKGKAVYLLYNGILGDEARNGGNILTRAILSKLPAHDGSKTIYAAGCMVSDDILARQNAEFRQTPYQIRIR